MPRDDVETRHRPRNHSRRPYDTAVASRDAGPGRRYQKQSFNQNSQFYKIAALAPMKQPSPTVTIPARLGPSGPHLTPQSSEWLALRMCISGPMMVSLPIVMGSSAVSESPEMVVGQVGVSLLRS